MEKLRHLKQNILIHFFRLYPELKKPSQSLKIQEKIKEHFNLNLNIFTIDRMNRKLRSPNQKEIIAESNWREYFKIR